MTRFPKWRLLDELQTFVGNKKNKIWLWTAVNKGFAGILAWTIGDTKSDYGKLLMIEASGSFRVKTKSVILPWVLGETKAENTPGVALARANPPK